MEEKELAALKTRVDRAERLKDIIQDLEELLEHDFTVKPFTPEHGDHGVYVQRSFGDFDFEDKISAIVRKEVEIRVQELKQELKNL